MEKYINLAKKLKQLAERGIGGEKYNVEIKLKELMMKYNLRIEDIEGEKEDFHTFNFEPHNKKLFFQVASTLLGSDYDTYSLGGKKIKNNVILKLTVAQAIEIRAKFDFYLTVFNEEYEVFYSAFIYSQRLYPPDSNKNNESKNNESAEDKAKILKIANMAITMDKKSFHKQISSK